MADDDDGANGATDATTTVVLGCGFAGTAVARRVLAAPGSHAVVATTRDAARAAALRALGIEVHALPVLTPDAVRAMVPAGANVLVAFPPAGAPDDAVLAAAVSHARAVVYVSTTGVYGAARGRVDEDTPVDPREARAASRLAAEQAYRAVGAVVLRPAGIYGPGRGLHLRVARGDYRVPGEGTNVVSRIHVEDLAAVVCAAWARAPRGATYVVADDAPVPQIEAIAWLCARLGRALPPSVPLAEAPETLRHDRAVDNARVKAALGVALRYPSYREGFAHVLAADGVPGAS